MAERSVRTGSAGRILHPGIRRTLVLRILATGLAAIAGSVIVMGIQIHQKASDERTEDVQRRATHAAENLTALFAQWHDAVQIASHDAALTDWFRQPRQRDELHDHINSMLVGLNTIHPELIDEACFIAASGKELARQVQGVAADESELSDDESQVLFFAPALQVVDKDKAHQSKPYLSPDSKRWVIANTAHIAVDGRTVALLHIEANLDAVRAIVSESLGAGMSARVVDVGLGKVITDTATGTPIVDQDFADAGDWNTSAGPIQYTAEIPVGEFNDNDWRVELSAPDPDPFTGSLLMWTTAGILVAGAMVAAVAFQIATAIAKPIIQVTETTESIVASGDRSRRVGVDARYEVGALSRAVDTMLDWLSSQDAELHQAQQARENQLRANWEKQQLAEKQIRERAQSVINRMTGNISQELEEVISQVGTVRSTAGSIDDRVSAADAATGALVGQADQANRVLGEFGDSLRRVDGIAKMIGGVAGQTNLLALNATIEAVRAGAAGAGFAVVADEVKTLASETARSTAEIADTIKSLEHDATEMTSTIAGMVEGIRGIREATAEIKHVVMEQSGTVERLNHTVGETKSRIDAMSHVTDDMERRASERFAADGPTFLDDGHNPRQEATLADISDGGMRCSIVSGELPALGSVVDLEVTLGNRVMRLSGRVVHHLPENSVGIQFIDPPAAAVEYIRETIEKLLHAR